MLTLIEMYLQGVSTPKVAAITEELCGSSFSKCQVSALAGRLDAELAAWRERLLRPSCPYLRHDYCLGEPDPVHISTSYVERQNLTMRMSMRRFTRLTNAFSKKIEILMHAVSLHFMFYNFARVHQTIKTTPAMAAGIADHVWTIEEIIGLLDSN